MQSKKRKIRISIILLIVLTLLCSSNATFVLAKDEEVILGGFAIGFDISSEGALVVGLSEVICENGVVLPAKEAGIKCGDYILSLNGKKITCAQDIDDVLKNNEEHFVIAELLSNGEKCIKNIFPQKDITGSYKLGLLVRDYVSGLGTVTFINKSGYFCSLGHPILDEQGNLLKITNGLAYKCQITGVVKGERGKAGELKGKILRNQIFGNIVKNSNVGLYGKIENNDVIKNAQTIKIGFAKPGEAEILATINGTQPKKFDISIIKVDENDKLNKNLVIKVTDKDLIAEANGIVQGMSGSPIIQDGKLVGAITHVFLNDSTKGFGIGISKLICDFN